MATAVAMVTSPIDWERLWAPYDEPTYQAVLDTIKSTDVVLDIGAGDLRLAYRLARRARSVYALEINPEPALARWARSAEPRPANLHTIWADAYDYPFPAGITVGVLLMRHCRRLAELATKLRAGGCRWLITNARWGMGVERMDLQAKRLPYVSLAMGWYACWCGATGFIAGPAQELTPELEGILYEVSDCPACAGRSMN